jgi:Phage major capsid protein E
MASLDVFRGDMFSTIALTTAVEKVPYKPGALGEMGIFEPDPIRNTTLAIESRQGKLVLVPFSERGQEGTQRTTEKRKGFFFDIPRLMHDDTITANELQNIRAFGTETELMQIEAEVARRVAGPTGLTSNIEYTWEYQRLAAVQGLCLDADGTVKFNFFNEFSIAQPAEVPFNLAAGVANSLRPICNNLIRLMSRASQGAFTTSTRVMALCGDSFYDLLVNHPDVIRTYINWAAAADLRDGSQGAAFEAFSFSGITWLNYRGSDDATTIAIATDKAKFFPVGAPGVFKVAYAPGESFEWVNTPGKPMYLMPIFDRDRNAWWKVEAYSYPLHICVRPEVLQSGRAEA